MRTTSEILASYRDAMKRRFIEVTSHKALVPSTVDVPGDSLDALELGLALGRSDGYGKGLVDGTELGLNVGLDSVDELLSQPVIFGPADPA